MIRVTKDISINEAEIHYDFIRSSGPGGQNVNKVSTAVKLRYDVEMSPSLPENVRKRLLSIAGSRITNDGILIIDARRHRTREQNRKDAIERLVKLIQKAAEKPKPRRKTKPTLASQKRRLDGKSHTGKIKKMRHVVLVED
jgi:ribosome-associated protein